MYWSRERYLDLMCGKKPERQMFCELFGPLVGLEDEWRRQGASEGEIDLKDFCFDYMDIGSTGAKTGFMGGFEPATLFENDTYTVTRDEMGRTLKMYKKVATIGLPLDYPVKDMQSWRRMKPFYEYREDRVGVDSLRAAADMQKKGAIIFESIPGAFDTPRQLMGEEMLCYAVYDQPELINDIICTISETTARVLEKVVGHVVPDCLCVHEDMAGKSGSLYGPPQVERFMKPHYAKAWEIVKRKGCRLFSQDSDGNMNSVMDAMIDCGVNVFYPLEPAAGMDMVKLREKYGVGISFKGGIDKHALRLNKSDIRKELEYKMSPLMREGGCVFALDHRIPNNTPLANYRYYVDAAREILGLPPRSADEKGWIRMAF